MQAQMIYPQSNVATMIAGRLSKSKGTPYAVTKVTTGFQVAPVVKVEPKKPLPIPTAAAQSAAPKTWTGIAYHTAKLRFRGESASYVDAWIDGKPVSFGKSTLIGWEVEQEAGETMKWVVLRMPIPVAKKRGLV